MQNYFKVRYYYEVLVIRNGVHIVRVNLLIVSDKK